MLEILKYIFLGIIQGICEVIPVSSSAHLLLVENLLKISDDNLFFEIFLHIASLIALCIYERKKIIKLICGFFNYIIKKGNKEEFIYVINLVIATIPIVIFTIIFQDYINIVSESILLIGLFLMLNGILLKLADKRKCFKKNITYIDAFKVGLFQCLGVFPGISRSGSCLVGSSFVNIDKDKGKEFTFLLFIPIMIGAILKSIFEYKTIDFSSVNITLYLISFIIALISSYLSLHLINKIIDKGKLTFFGMYTFILGLIVLFITLFNF